MKHCLPSDDFAQGDPCYVTAGVLRRLLARIIDCTSFMIIGISSIFLITSFPIRNRTEIISIFQPEPLPLPPARVYIEISAVPDVDPWTLVFLLHLVGALFLVFPALLYELLLTATQGQTIGKIITKIKVINTNNGQAPGWTKSTARWAVLYLPILIPIIGIPIFLLILFSALLNENRQGWHDKIAKTMVVSSSTEKIIETNKVPSTIVITRRRIVSRTVDWILYPIVGITLCIWLMILLQSAGITFIDIYSDYSSNPIEPTKFYTETGQWVMPGYWVWLRLGYESISFRQYLNLHFGLHMVIIGLVIIFIYELPLTALLGQTAGKILIKARVVCINNGRVPGWKKAGIRWMALYLPLLALPIIGIPIFLLTAASPFFNQQRRGWHDKIAGTIVVPTSIDTPRG